MSEFKYMPVEPTEEMMTAAAQMGYTGHVYLRVWKAMIASAPTQPSPAESDKESVRNAALDEAYIAVKNRLTSLVMVHRDDIATVLNDIESLKSQPAQPSDTEKDAARYRWLREQDNDIECVFNVVNKLESTGNLESFKTGQALDAAIDDAIRAEREG